MKCVGRKRQLIGIASAPTRGPWIEIGNHHRRRRRYRRRPPHGGRGLKLEVWQSVFHEQTSAPTRGPWIEMQ